MSFVADPSRDARTSKASGSSPCADNDVRLARMRRVTDELGLQEALFAGVLLDEDDRPLRSQCLYQALARSFLGNEADESPQNLALQFKRSIDGAVLHARPAFRERFVGDNLPGYGSFLHVALGNCEGLQDLC
eukprot:2992718-Heterocapsa_arctica.AAC.1